MAEAQKGFATLEDVDEATFVRFIEWAHKGFYTAAEFRAVEQNHDAFVPPPPQEYDRNDEFDEDVAAPAAAPEGAFDFGEVAPVEPEQNPMQNFGTWGQSGLSYKKGKKGKKGMDWDISIEQPITDSAHQRKMKLKEAFLSRRYTVRRSVIETPRPRANKTPEEDYTAVFLSHAQLYVFADKYDIQSLKVLALEELHATLGIYHLYSERTGDIIGLLRYIYGNTGEPRGGVEDMRTLIMEYVDGEMDMLTKDEDFKDLMIEDGGPLLGDFMAMVGRRTS